MKIFDFRNPRHLEILREELYRAKTIMLREYNESSEWNQMPTEYREWLLTSADDDMGPDFADEYAETDWMKIPDSVTNRIDISNYMLPEKYSRFSLAQIVDKNKQKLGHISVSDANHDVHAVIDFLKTGNPSRYYAYRVLAALFNNGVMINLQDLKDNPESRTLGKSSDKDDNTINPYDMPGGRSSRGYMGAKWTGD